MDRRMDKLALAAELRTLAIELRNHKRSHFYASIFPEPDENMRKRKLDQWDDANPLEAFLADAIAELDKIAVFIDDYCSSRTKM